MPVYNINIFKDGSLALKRRDQKTRFLNTQLYCLHLKMMKMKLTYWKVLSVTFHVKEMLFMLTCNGFIIVILKQIFFDSSVLIEKYITYRNKGSQVLNNFKKYKDILSLKTLRTTNLEDRQKSVSKQREMSERLVIRRKTRRLWHSRRQRTVSKNRVR